jgi:hypothetical protein
VATDPATSTFYETGSVADLIDVEVTYQIIGLFSEGLYSSPYKAVEELVSNAFDADAKTVHVVVPADLADPGAALVVLDDGTGMDDKGLKIHWIVGDSVKRRNRKTPGGRRTIGKFGIGKLAAYVLGDRLTHITRVGDEFFSTTMDFRRIPQTVHVEDELDAQQGNIAGPISSNGDSTESPILEEDSAPRGDPADETGPRKVQLELRHLTEDEARAALGDWLTEDDGRPGLTLFGPHASSSWTVAIVSDLKDMAQEISRGMLTRVLSTAMPLRDDFVLYLNDQAVPSWKVRGARVGRWILGKELKELPRPAPKDVEASTNEIVPEPAYGHWLLIDKSLGPISGYLEVYKDAIDSGKSNIIGRSNGFFVYVNGRLINEDDAGFGIDRNTLRHGTFSRFRLVVNIDRLDAELRSSRENLRDSPQVTRAQELLQGIFNFARSKLEDHQAKESTGRQASQRLAESPASLSERPVLRVILAAYEGTFRSRHIVLSDTQAFADAAALRAHIEDRVEKGAGVVTDVEYGDLGTQQPIAILDGVTGVLSINLEHPFVAHFADEFNDPRRNLPLQLFAMSEILLEAQLYESGVAAEDAAQVLDERDELLRHLARSTGARNSLVVAQELQQSASSKSGLEAAVVAAFDQLGFAAIPKGGKDDSDGLAEAFLAPDESGSRYYRVSLEAKSKEQPGKRIKKSAVEVSTIARHRDENDCNHAIVVGPAIETGPDDKGAVVREIDKDRETHKGKKTITLMTIADLARLVRIAPVKQLNLIDLRQLFIEARTPSEARNWVDEVYAQQPPAAQHREILDTVYAEQQADRDNSVTYDALRRVLRISKHVVIDDDDLRDECRSIARMAGPLFFALDDRVELNSDPDTVMRALREYVQEEHAQAKAEA